MSQRSRITRSTSSPVRRAHIALASLVCLRLAACESPNSLGTNPPSPDSAVASIHGLSVQPTIGEPLANLTTAELARFSAGLDEFLAAEALDEGLGPVFNEASCATCHNGPVGGTTGRKETRFGKIVN